MEKRMRMKSVASQTQVSLQPDRLILGRPVKPKVKRDYTKRKHVPRCDSEPSRKAINTVIKERKAEGILMTAEQERRMIEKEHKPLDTINAHYVFGEYRDLFTFSKKTTSPTWAESFARELVAWARNTPDAIKVNEFLMMKGVSMLDFHHLFVQYPILKEAYNIAKSILGNTRERNVLENKWNASAGIFMMGHYDEDWRKETERREAAKVKQAEATGVDFKALMLDMTAPVAPTEEVREKLAKDKKRMEE